MSHAWYYAGRDNQRHGPVDDTTLAAALARGEVHDATLVWREGYPDWVPLARARPELGLPPAELSRSRPPMPAAGAASDGAAALRAGTPSAAGASRIAPPTKGGGGWLLALVIIGIVVLFVGAIFAAIAIPAYADYTHRAKVAQSINALAPLKVEVAEHYQADETCLANGEGGIGAPERYATELVSVVHVGELDGRCAIVAVYKDFGVAGSEGAELVLKLGEDGAWQTSSTLPDRVLPAPLRSN